MLASRLGQLARYLGRHTISTSHPAEVFLEPTNRCNLDCTTCPRQISDRPTGLMDWALYERIVEQLAGRTELLHLYVYGEPLLHPRLPEMVALAARRGLAVSFATNGTLLDAGVSRALLEAGLAQLIVSIDAADAEHYRRQRVGGDFDAVVANVEAFAAERRRLGRRTSLVLSAVTTDRLLAELPAFLAFARALPVDGQRFESYIDVVEQPLLRRAPGRTARTRGMHFYLWRKLYLLWDGRATACPQNLHLDRPELVVGDLREQPLAEVWNGPRLRAMRERALQGRAPTACCDGCGFPAHPLWMYAGKLALGDAAFHCRVQPALTTALARVEALRRR